jgi:hypothetical protein
VCTAGGAAVMSISLTTTSRHDSSTATFSIQSARPPPTSGRFARPQSVTAHGAPGLVPPPPRSGRAVFLGGQKGSVAGGWLFLLRFGVARLAALPVRWRRARMWHRYGARTARWGIPPGGEWAARSVPDRSVGRRGECHGGPREPSNREHPIGAVQR